MTKSSGSSPPMRFMTFLVMKSDSQPLSSAFQLGIRAQCKRATMQREVPIPPVEAVPTSGLAVLLL